jgi:3-oxoacyl-[acyl-carrier-protein] synthase-3
MRSRIIGTGSYLPRRTVGNAELAPLVEESAEVIRCRTGVVTRQFADQEEAASDLALCASLEAFKAAGCDARDIDCIVFATQTPDYYFPGSGCVLGAKLGLIGVPALDVRNQCAGFLYGLSVADHFIRLGTYRRLLVVAADVMSGSIELSPRGREAALRFSDGAGAAIVAPEPDHDRGILATGLHADGRFARLVMIERPGSRRHGPLTTRDLDAGLHLPVIGGPEVLSEGYRHLRDAIAEALETSSLPLDDVALIILNQSCAQIAPLLCRRLRLARERLYVNVEDHGDATGASLPICLDEAARTGRIRPGDAVLLLAFGSGFTWAWSLLRW